MLEHVQTSQERPKSAHKSVPGDVALVSLVEYSLKSKKSYNTENLTLKRYVGRKLFEILGIDYVIREMKTLYPNFENVISELCKRYIRSMKTLHPNFKNVISEL